MGPHFKCEARPKLLTSLFIPSFFFSTRALALWPRTAPVTTSSLFYYVLYVAYVRCTITCMNRCSDLCCPSFLSVGGVSAGSLPLPVFLLISCTFFFQVCIPSAVSLLLLLSYWFYSAWCDCECLILYSLLFFVCIIGFCLRTGWFWVRIMDGALGMATVGYEYFITRLNTLFLCSVLFCSVFFFFFWILPLYQLFCLPCTTFLAFFLHGFAWGNT